MIRTNVNSLGFDLTKEFPASVEEYNSLAPKRVNPVLEDANLNTFYRSTLPEFREKYLEALAKQTGIARQNSGTEEDPVWEKESKYHARVIATLVGGGKTEAEVRASLLPLAQAAMDAASFSPAARESTSDGPAIGKGDQKLAEEIEKDGKLAAVAEKLSARLNRVVSADVKSVARAIADDRKAKAAALAAQTKAELLG